MNCKGKYAGEIRLEFTYYDTRPKAEKPVVEKRRESTRPDGQGAAVGGPRESTPIKRRPLPSDPTGASPSPANTPEQRGLRGLRAGPREIGSPRHQQPVENTPRAESRVETPSRRPVPDASPLSSAPVSSRQTPQRPPIPQASYSTPTNPRASNSRVDLAREESFDMSYTAPKAYEVQTAEPGTRAISQDDFRSSRGPAQLPPPEPVHSHSAPLVPTQHGYELEFQQEQIEYPDNNYSSARSPSFAQDPYHDNAYQDPAYQVAPLRTSRSRDYSQEQVSPSEPYYGQQRYIEAPPQQDLGSARRRSAMQPMVEDEDRDLPPPPPVHRRNASTLPHPHQEESPVYANEAPAPLNISRYREEPEYDDYEAQPQQYALNTYTRQQPTERRMTHPRISEHASSRPESRDAMIPSPLRQETVALPSSLIPGHNPSWQDKESPAYQAPPSYETPPRLRHYSEPAEYRAITQYESAPQSQELVHHPSYSNGLPDYYPHDPPEQPRRTSPVHESQIVKPRATSPAITPRHSPNPASDRNSRGPTRSMPTRKSVSPRPPPSSEEYGERRLSGVAFNPDSFDVYNPRASRSPAPGTSDDERPGSSMEYNDRGQIVTFSGRVVDASDHLPIDNWAPEPVPKGTVKDKAPRSRAALNGSRDLEAARQREEKYRQDRAQRDRIRHAASATFDPPSNALVTTRHDFNNSSPANAGALVYADYDATPPGSVGRNRLQKTNPHQRPISSYDSPPQHTSPSMPMAENHVLRERQNPNSYGSSPAYDRGSYGRAPPIPAKIPLDLSGGREEDMALSLELQSIDIGPGSGGRKPRAQARRQYGF